MKQTVLIVDDDNSIIQSMYRILKDLDLNFKFSTKSEGVIDYIKKNAPDLILLDAEMPKIDGFEICSQVRQYLKDVPIIFVTSHCDENFEVAGLLAGASDFISKPINPAIFKGRVKNQLKVKALIDELTKLKMGERS